jgi:acetyl-CoA C-acetyltransferase
VTKHAAGVYSSEPAPHDLTAAKAPAAPSAPAAVELVAEAAGEARVESYTVTYERDGAPTRGIVIGRLEDDRRFLANTPPDRKALEALVETELVGRRGRVGHVDGMNRFEPH